MQKLNRKPVYVIALLLLVITLLHYYLFSTRIVFHNVIRILYYVPIIYAAFVYQLKGGVVVSSAVVVLYAPHLIMYFGKIHLDMFYQILELAMFITIGLLTGYLVQRDDNKRKAMEMQVIKITHLENYNHNILDSIDNGVVSFDVDGKVKFINKAVMDLFKQKEQLNIFLEKVFIKDSLEQVIKEKDKNILQEIDYEGDVYEVGCYPLRTISSDIEGVVVIIKKITIIKSLEEQVRRGERLAAVGNLAAGIAHEIRNPLGIIKTISQTLIEDQDDDNQSKEGLGIIEHEVNRANEVIKWLLDFAKPDKFTDEPVNFSELISQLAMIFSKYSEKQSVKIDFHVAENLWIKGDSEKLKQAFVNIILNGIQAIEGQGHLDVNLEAHEDTIEVAFLDNGKGMSKEILNKIFDPFFTTKPEGTGLGLALTYKIIEQHHGSIVAESELGVGTKIKVTLPRLTEARYE